MGPLMGEVSDLIAGRYQPLELLGGGETARVHRVIDRARGGAPLALKRVPAARAALVVEEFRRLQAFRFGGIPRVWELGADSATGDFLFTAELGRGRPWLAALRDAPLDRQQRAVADLLRILALLDERGIVHRDLKPEHLLVEDVGEVEGAAEPQVVLIDFGLATLSGTTVPAGSLPYLAPELFHGAPASHRTDLYALGVVLFELWAGERPFQAADATAWAHAHLEQPVVFPPEFRAPAPLREIVARLLAKEPLRRSAHASEVLADLSRAAPEPLPRTTLRTLLGRVRSVPPFDPLWSERLVAGDVRHGGTVTWVTAPTQVGREDLLRELRTLALLGEAWPLVVNFAANTGADTPRAALLAQLSALVPQPLPSEEELLARLQRGELPRRVALFLEEVDRCSSENEALLSYLLRARVEIVASGCGEARSNDAITAAVPLTEELRTLSPRPISSEELARAFPEWMGGELEEPLARFIGAGAGSTVDLARVVEMLCYAVESVALTRDFGGLHFDPSRVDLSGAKGDLLDVVRRRLSTLPVSRRALLEALAVLGVESGVGEIAALVPLFDEGELAALVNAGLVQPSNGRWRCAEGGVAALVLADLAPDRKRVLEAAAAAALLAARDDLPDLPLRRARHAFRAARESAAAARELATHALALIDAQRLTEGDAVARELLTDSGDAPARTTATLVRGIVELRRGSHAAAEQWLAPLVEQLTLEAERGRALVEHARALDRCGRQRDALARLDGAPDGLGLRAPGASALRAYLLHQLGRDAEAEAVCRIALADARVAGDGGTHRLLTIHAVTLWRLGRFGNARQQFDTALVAARATGQPLQVATLEGNLARFEEDCGRTELAVRLFRNALATAIAFGDRQQESIHAQNLANPLFDLGRFVECKQEIQRAREIAHAMNRPTVLRRIELIQAHVALNEGDFAAAHAALGESIRIARTIDDARGAWIAELFRSEILVREGKAKGSRHLLDQLAADPLAAASDDLRHVLAEFRLQWATWGGSRQAIERALASSPPLPASPRRRLFMRDARLSAWHRLGRHVELAQESEEQLRELEGTDLVALRARAAAAAAFASSGHSPAEATRGHFARARQCYAEVQAPGWSALKSEAALALGQALGDPRLLEEAEELAHRAGHRPLARRAALLRRRHADQRGHDPDLADRLASLERLMQVAKSISATLDGEELLRVLLDHAIDATRARRGFLILARGGHLDVRVARHLDAADIDRPELAFSSSVARNVARDGQPVLLSDVSSDERFRDAASISQLKLLSVLCVPLRRRDAVVGSLYLDDPTRIDAFRASDLAYVENLADFAAIALEKTELLGAVRTRTEELERTQQEIARLNRDLQSLLVANQGELLEVKASLERARRAGAHSLEFEGIVSQSAVMEEVKRRIERCAESDLPVLISGESGTGKDLVARALHQRGPRREQPFEPVNCASLQPSLIENELFGHLRGAYTGAVDDQPGLFERTDGGTLFLDEVCDASLELQAKLLRVVQRGEVQRLGGGPSRKVDVRIVAASNRDLRGEVAAGRFREDLMFRLLVLEIHLPPLRERREDVPLLLEHFVAAICAKTKLQPLQFTPAAWRRLVQYDWPGNVRELEHAVHRLALLHRFGEEIGIEALRAELPAAVEGEPQPVVTLKEFTARQERTYIQEVLARNGGNREKTAKELGISLRNLYQRLERMRGDEPGKDEPPGDGPNEEESSTER